MSPRICLPILYGDSSQSYPSVHHSSLNDYTKKESGAILVSRSDLRGADMMRMDQEFLSIRHTDLVENTS